MHHCHPCYSSIMYFLNDESPAMNCTGPARTMYLTVVSLTPFCIHREGCPLDGLLWVHCRPSLLGAHLVPLIMTVWESVCTYAINLTAPGSTGFSMIAQHSYALEEGLQHTVSPLYRNKVSVSPSQKYWAHWYRPYFFSLLLRESCGTVSKAFLKQNMSHLLPSSSSTRHYFLKEGN